MRTNGLLFEGIYFQILDLKQGLNSEFSFKVKVLFVFIANFPIN